VVIVLAKPRSSWFGLFAPPRTPNAIVSQLRAATSLIDPAVRSRLADIGLEIFPPERQNPAALGALQKADAAKWWPLIKEFGISGSAPTVPVSAT
jgi:tripartite-type tricarboxylate transporter receptor subunit TctC